MKVEIEVDSLAQWKTRWSRRRGRPLDNMARRMARAVTLGMGRGVLEVSGDVTLATVADYARAGADLISVGALTHSVQNLDVGLDIAM